MLDVCILLLYLKTDRKKIAKTPRSARDRRAIKIGADVVSSFQSSRNRGIGYLSAGSRHLFRSAATEAANPCVVVVVSAPGPSPRPRHLTAVGVRSRRRRAAIKPVNKSYDQRPVGYPSRTAVGECNESSPGRSHVASK